MTNGGVMIGSTVSARSNRVAFIPVRVTASANTSPSSVVSAPTRIASTSEFQATPQCIRPPTQPRPQILRSDIFSANSPKA